MRTKHWIFVSILMGVLTACFGEACFLLLLTITWGCGAVHYLLYYGYMHAYARLGSKKPLPYKQKVYRGYLAFYRRRAYLCEKRARILMYLGCIAIIEAVIIL